MAKKPRPWLQPISYPKGSLSDEQRASIHAEAGRQAAEHSPADCLSIVTGNAIAAVAKAEGVEGFSQTNASKCI